METENKKKKFRIKWWWGSEEEEKAKNDIEYAKKIQKEMPNNEKLREKVTNSSKKDPELAKTLERAKEEIENDPSQSKSESNFFPWGDNSQAKQQNNDEGIKNQNNRNSNQNERKPDTMKNADEAQYRNTEINSNTKGESENNIKGNEKDTTQNQRDNIKSDQQNGRDNQNGNMKTEENEKGSTIKNNDKGWFSWGNNKSQNNDNLKEDKDQDNPNVTETDRNNQKSNDNQEKGGGSWFSWGNSKSKSDDYTKDGSKNKHNNGNDDNKESNLQEEKRNSKDNGNYSNNRNKDKERDPNNTSDKNNEASDQSRRSIFSSLENMDEKKVKRFLLYLGLINVLMIIILLLCTEIFFDCSVLYNTFSLCMLTISIIPFVLIPFTKKSPCLIIGIISTIFTVFLIIFMFINRVHVYFYKLSLNAETFEKLVAIKKLKPIERFDRIVELDTLKMYRVKSNLEHSKKIGVKILLLEYDIKNRSGDEEYDPNKANIFFQNQLKEKKNERNPILNPLLSLSWSKDDENKALINLGKTKFSKYGKEYVFIIGLFKLDESAMKSLKRKISDITSIDRI